MFTGLVERLGVVAVVRDLQDESGAAREFTVRVDEDYLRDVQLGESISINGTCLTVTEFTSNEFKVMAVEETLRRTTLGRLREDNSVNVERAMLANGRLGGHIVQGHVDGTATVVAVRQEGESRWITFEPHSELMKYIVEKGSVCLDGVSLTVANLAYSKFSVALIPHTLEVTTAGGWQPGIEVNLEVDVIAKYVERLTQWDRRQGQQE